MIFGLSLPWVRPGVSISRPWGCAKEGAFEEAHAKIAEADAIYAGGHEAHQDLLQLQGEGEEMPFDLLLVHAEDQMMSAECFKVMAMELIEIYEKRLSC